MAEKLMPEQPNLPPPEMPRAPGEQQEGVSVEQQTTQEKPSLLPVEQPVTATPAAPAQQTPLPPKESVKSETLEAIEDIMEEDLADMYAQMPADRKKLFREKGEETAEEIETMLYKVKFHSKKVFKLLFAWMKIIPGVSKYFLEQEAKLKADEIMHLKEKIDQERQQKL